MKNDKASLILVEALVKRVNKLEETVAKGGIPVVPLHKGKEDKKGHGTRVHSPSKITDGELSDL